MQNKIKCFKYCPRYADSRHWERFLLAVAHPNRSVTDMVCVGLKPTPLISPIYTAVDLEVLSEPPA